MRAFVLGGGGNLGSMQVGALNAMFDRQIEPDILLGCSVGALNAAILASGFAKGNLEKLRSIWSNVNLQDIYPGNKLQFAWRLFTRQEALCDNKKLYALLVRSGLDPEMRFGDLDIPLFVTATNLDSGELTTFGKNPQDLVIDALMASTAQPPYLPPWMINEQRFIDGGAVTPLPLRVAIEMGAEEIFSFRIEHESKSETTLDERSRDNNMVGVVSRSINMMIQQQAELDLHIARSVPQLRLHQIELRNDQILRTDFSQSDRLMNFGYKIALSYLRATTSEAVVHRFPQTLAMESRSDSPSVQFTSRSAELLPVSE